MIVETSMSSGYTARFNPAHHFLARGCGVQSPSFRAPAFLLVKWANRANPWQLWGVGEMMVIKCSSRSGSLVHDMWHKCGNNWSLFLVCFSLFLNLCVCVSLFLPQCLCLSLSASSLGFQEAGGVLQRGKEIEQTWGTMVVPALEPGCWLY